MPTNLPTVAGPGPSDDERGVQGIDLYVNSDRGQLAGLVHATGAEGALHGRSVIVPDAG